MTVAELIQKLEKLSDYFENAGDLPVKVSAVLYVSEFEEYVACANASLVTADVDVDGNMTVYITDEN